MFCNILAEMARKQISNEYMAEKLGISVKMFEQKIKNINHFKLSEIFILQKTFNNPNCTFEYLLFNTNEKVNS